MLGVGGVICSGCRRSITGGLPEVPWFPREAVVSLAATSFSTGHVRDAIIYSMGWFAVLYRLLTPNTARLRQSYLILLLG